MIKLDRLIACQALKPAAHVRTLSLDVLQSESFKRGGGGMQDEIIEDEVNLHTVRIMREVVLAFLAPRSK